MIKRIELTNFMSHEHTVLEPAAGLTVLVGPNNCGKSAVVAALQILTSNANSTYVMRHGCKECSVVVETDDGHRIEWRRKKAASYVIDGEKFDRLDQLEGGLPAELPRALRLKEVQLSKGESVDIHFGEQKSPMFLLTASEAHAAKFFAASSDVSQLVAMQNRHKAKHGEAKKRKIKLEAESAKLTKELDALAPATLLDKQLEQQEAAYRELGQLAEELKAATQLEADLQRAVGKLAALSVSVAVLAPLAPPPELAPTAPPTQLLANLAREQNASERESRRAETLRPLLPPPQLLDTQALASVIQRLTAAGRACDENQARGVALAPLDAPPDLADTLAANSLVARLTAALQSQQRANQALQSLSALAQPPALADEQPLRVAITALTLGAKRHKACAAIWSVVQEIQSPPEISDPAPLADWLQRVGKQTADSARHEREFAALQVEALATAEQLREWARDQETCPTCGAALDPDRLVTTVCTAGGAHHA